MEEMKHSHEHHHECHCENSHEHHHEEGGLKSKLILIGVTVILLITAVFIEKDADTGVSVLDIEKLLAYFTSHDEDEDAATELIPVTIEGDNSIAFGFVRYDVCDRLLDFRVENGTPFYNAVQKVLNDMSAGETFGIYDFENVLTKIIR